MAVIDFRKTAPPIRTIETVSLPEPEKLILDNGIPVYFIHAGTQDLVRIDLIFDAGSWFQEQPLQAYLTSQCLPEGTENFTSKAISETIDFYGAYLKHTSSKDDAVLSLYCLNKHLYKLMPVFSEVALKAVFPADDVRTIISKERQEFMVNMQKVKYIAMQKHPGLLFGKNHPYGIVATEGDFQKADASVLKRFYTRFYSNSLFNVIVSGMINPGTEELLNRYFGQHPILPTVTDHTGFTIETTPQTGNYIEKAGSLQSALRIGKVMFTKNHPDFIPFVVLNTILGGYFGSRLMTNIREDKGYTYGIGSAIASFRHAGMFFIASEVGNDATKLAMDEIFREIERLRSEPVGNEELNLVKNYLLGTFLRSADGPFAMADLFRNVLDFGQDMKYYDRFVQMIKNITIEEIRHLAVNYLDSGSFVSLVVGSYPGK